MKKLLLTSPLPPSVNGYLNFRVAKQNGKSFVQAYPAPATVIYNRFFIDYVKDQIREQEWIRPEKGKLVYVRMVFYLERKRKDPNNLIKVPLDALTEAGVYFDDDVALPLADRVYLDVHNPRIEIEVFESDAIGIFNDEEELAIFKSYNCMSCRKEPEKCTIMRKLLDNRLVPEVTAGICHAKK